MGREGLEKEGKVKAAGHSHGVMTVEMQQKWVMGAMMNEKLEQEGRERGVHSSGVVEVLYLEWLEGEGVRGMQGEVGGNSRGRQK